jgi:hypothetical protein
MPKITQNVNYKIFSSDVKQKVKHLNTLEAVAQVFMESIFETFKESIILCRLFVTVPYNNLPETNKNFVTKLTKTRKVHKLLKKDTLVLSLLGTSGLEKKWNNRRNSQGHIGIPLVSPDFIGEIPMMSRLLKELGLNINWIDNNDTGLVKHTIGNLNGMFYVEDAATEKDHNGRLIITSQDFVKKYNIKTVIGFGGSYIHSGTFFTSIIFLNEKLSQPEARRFTAEMSFFKTISTNCRNIIFKD